MGRNKTGKYDPGKHSRTAQSGSQDLPFEFTGGRLCLDFANTVSKRPTFHPQDRLTNFPRLVAWSREARILTAREARRLMRKSIRRPQAATHALEHAVRLREAIYRIFSAIAAARRPLVTDLSTLNATLAEAMAMSRIIRTVNGFEWNWQHNNNALDRMVWPVARSAADLLVSGEWVVVRECSGRTCRWLFLDNSRNHSRRWCDMTICGNREKARRHYRRTKSLRIKAR